MLDPWQLRTFLAVADSLSFRQAAKALHQIGRAHV